MKFFPVLCTAVLLCPLSLAAQEHQHPVPEKLGTVNFPTSCAPTVQKQFERGVALLHSFAYVPAEEAFREIAQADEKCAMAHWGIAMSFYHQLWDPQITAQDLKRGAAEMETARNLKSSERERAYIEALSAYYGGEERSKQARAKDYEQAMAKVAAQYSRYSEEQVFYALALLATAPPTDRTHANQKKAVAILEPIHRAQPQHPGVVHYLIHAYDNAELAAQGLPVAREYSQVAPDAPHALHMPSHTFTRLGMWSDSVTSNLAARTAARQQGNLPEALHAMDYLMYAYLQMGSTGEATKLLQEASAEQGDVSNAIYSYAVAAMPVRFAIEQGRWEEASKLDVMPPQAPPQVRAIRLWARGSGLARLGKAEEARHEVEGLQSARAELEKAGNAYWATQAEIQIKEVQALIAQAGKKNDEAVSLMRAAADQEDGVEKLPVTPGPIVPAREQLAAMLLEMKRPKEAMVEYKASLALAPGRRASLAGAVRAAGMAGNAARSKKRKDALSSLR